MPSFLVDGMLGDLSRWLRISGFDTLYYRDKTDDELLSLAMGTGRILLTRDRDLHKRVIKLGANSVLVSGEGRSQQLQQLKDHLGLTFSPQFSRCPKCNGELTEISKENVADRVPETSLNAFDEFWGCLECLSVYWKGSHWDNIQKTLDGF